MTNLVIKQGTDPVIKIPNVRDGAGVLVTNWSGFVIKGQIRERAESSTVLFEWTSQGGSANVTFSGSDVLLSVPHAVSSGWAWTRGRYDVELTDPSGQVACIAEGHVIIEREVTR